MTDEMIALGRRAVACSKWKWLDGMRDFRIHEERYNAEHEGFLEVDGYGLGYTYKGLYPNSLPDFSDPATLGCLLALVRETYINPTIFVRWFESGPDQNKWAVCYTEGGGGAAFLYVNRKYVWGDTEAEALVVALEAANAL